MNRRNLRHWLTVAACCGLAASSIGICSNSVGVFYTPVSEALGVGRGAVALHATLSLLFCGFFSPVVARLMQRFPLRPILLAGVILATGSTALMAATNDATTLYLLGAVRGIGLSCFSLMPVTAVIGHWFKKRHGLAMGITLSFSGLSGAVFNPVLGRLIALFGWRSAFLFMALFALLPALPGALLLRLTPEEAGLSAYGADRPRPRVMGQPGARAPIPWSAPLLILGCMTVLHTSVTGIAQHFTGYAESIGLGAQTGAMLVSAGMLGNIFTKLAIGVISDRVGPFRACRLMICVNAAALLALMLLPASLPLGFGVAAFFYGAVYSVGAVGIPLVTRRVFGAERYASAYSVLTVLTNVGSASALTLIGLAFDLTGTYRLAYVCAIAFDCINFCLLLALAGILRTRKGRDFS